MRKHPTIAIYSGVSFSTTFIERLIKGLAEADVTIYIFGVNTGTPLQHKNIRYIVYGKRWHKLLILIKYSCLLFLFKPKAKKKLDRQITASRKSTYFWKLKYYPVLYHQPDIFHIQWAKSIKDWVWVKDFGMKLVVSLRGTHITISPKTNVYWENLYLKYFPCVDGFHAVSNSLADEILNYNIINKRARVVKSGVDITTLNYFEKATLHSTLKILSIGRPHFTKGFKYGLDAISKFQQLGGEFHYTIIGVENNEALLFQRAQLGLENNITFKDALSFYEVQKAIQNADVLLLPSVEEGIANVVLEAMALGTLVVSTDCGGMKEVVLPKQTGYLVPVRDAQAMALALKEVSELPLETYQRITQQARAFVEANHSEAQMVSGMLGLYNRLMVEGPDKVN